MLAIRTAAPHRRAGAEKSRRTAKSAPLCATSAPARLCGGFSGRFVAADRVRHPRGFTLIELMITVAIISLLASIAIPMAETVVQRNREAELRVALRHIRSAIDAYKEAFDQKRILPPVGEAKPDMSGYPPDLEALYKGVPDAKDPKGAKMYFLRRLPRDPFADASLPADKTWGLRAYKSPPDDPQPGEDVYDVYSQAQGKGLNGIPYKEW